MRTQDIGIWMQGAVTLSFSSSLDSEFQQTLWTIAWSNHDQESRLD